MLNLIDERQRRLVFDSLWLGAVGAGAAQLFTWLLHTAQHFLLTGLAGYTPPGLPSEGGILQEQIGAHGLWLIPLVTTLGGLISGVLVFSLAPEAEGHGTDAAVKSYHRAGGFLRPIVTPLKMVASAITIGSGGAAGREGPTALIAAGIGSIYGTLRRRTDEERRLLLLIGMAAGLSAIFRTPIGAALLAIEVLYSESEFEANALLYTLLSSVVAYTVNGLIVGWEPLFEVPASLGIEGSTQFLEFALLGVFGGLVAALLPTIFYGARDLFHRVPVPVHIKPAIGGLLVGLMALAIPEVLGGGYGWIQQAMDGNLSLELLATLVFAKIVAMALTVGSGGSGGVFAPTLFSGAMLGGVLANVFNEAPTAFVLVGMAAVFSGAARVPLATMFMVTEMTGGYRLLPLAALVVTISYLTQVTATQRLKYRSLYEAQIPYRPRREVDLLEGVLVQDAMSTEFDSVPADLPVQSLVDRFERTHHHGFTVVDGEGKLVGVVSLSDLSRAMLHESLEGWTVQDIATVDGLVVSYPDEPVSAALWRMAVREVGRLPIVDRNDHRKLVGVIRRSDVIHAYERAIEQRTSTSYRLKELRDAHEGRVRVVEVDITPSHPLSGKTIQQISGRLPDESIIVSIRRDRRLIIAHGDTVLQPGDHVVAICGASQVPAMEQSLVCATSQPADQNRPDLV